MNIILLGPQGSGKGTQAELLIKKYGLGYVEMGKILRSIGESDNKYADEVKNVISAGGLVDDELVRLIAWDYISKHDRSRGFIFDGYPRSVEQYEHLQDMLRKFGKKIDAVVDLEISKEESIRRLSARRMCVACGEIYNLITNPPPNGRCQKCGGEKFEQRSDDSPSVIEKRLDIYRERTEPLVKRAQKEGLLVEINGEQPIEMIFKELEEKLEKRTDK